MFHLIPTPSGRFAFVGKVPGPLAYETSDPAYLETAAHSGPGFAAKHAAREGGYFRSVSFATAAAAEAAALEWAGSPDELVKHYAAAKA